MTATIEAHGLTKRYGKTKALDGLIWPQRLSRSAPVPR